MYAHNALYGCNHHGAFHDVTDILQQASASNDFNKIGQYHNNLLRYII